MKNLIKTSTKDRHREAGVDDITLPDLDIFIENETTMDTSVLETSMNRLIIITLKRIQFCFLLQALTSLYRVKTILKTDPFIPINTDTETMEHDPIMFCVIYYSQGYYRQSMYWSESIIQTINSDIVILVPEH